MQRIEPRRLSLVIILLGPVLLFGRMILSGEVLYWGTPMLQFVPWHRLAIDTLNLGQIPLWNPLLGLGAPLLANLQSALLYPPNALLLIVGPERGHGYLVVLHLAFAGLGMAYLARRLGMGAFGQLIAGLSFSLSGYMVARAWFISINHAAAWLPWIILSAERLLDQSAAGSGYKKLIPAILGMSLTLSMQWLAGHAQTAWYTLILLIVWVAWRLIKNWRRPFILQAITGFIVASCLAFALASAQLLPTLEYLALSQRALSLDREFALTYSFWPWRFLGLLLPDLFGNPASGDYWGYGNYWEDAIYIGIMPLLLGLGAMSRGLRRSAINVSLERFLLGVSFITLLLALGKNTPLFTFLYDHVPTFDLFQAPSRWNLLLIFSLALLAGRGAEVWKTPEARALYWTRLLTAGAGIIAVASLIGLRLFPDLEPSFIRSFIVSGILLTTSGLLILFLPKQFVNSKIMLIGGFVVLDLVLAGRGLNPSISPDVFEGNVLGEQGISPGERIYMPLALEEELKFEQTHRFDRFDSGFRWERIRKLALPNTSMLDGVASFNNFDPLLSERYVRFQSALDALEAGERDALLAWMDVSFRVDLDPVDSSAVRFEPLPNAGRVYLVSDVVAASSPDHALALVTSGELDLSTQVVLENYVPSGVIEQGKSRVWSVDDAKPGSVTITVECEREGWLVLADAWYPGWVAEVDGSAVEIRPANYLFRAVPVPAGKHSVEFTYQPSSFSTGVGLSLVGLTTTVLIGLLCFRRD